MPHAVILTALPVEYLSVRKYLIDLEEKEHPQGTIYEQGKYVAQGQEWEVGIAQVGAGNAGAAVEADRAIAYFQPNILFFVGIAGGIKDVAIGDVVVATEVYNYESGKVGEQFLTRPKAGKSAYKAVKRAEFEAKQGKWLQRLKIAPIRQPSVFVAPIVAGEKVIASRKSDLFQFLRTNYNDAIALEMEGFGFLNAAFAYPEIQAVVIRGISDLIEGKNDDSVEPEDNRQVKASQHASAFAFEILAKLEKTYRGTRQQGRELFFPFNWEREALLENSSPQSVVPRVTQRLSWLTIVASFTITAVGGFKLIRGELEPLTAILLAVGFVSLLSICLYIWFKRSRIDGSEDRLVKHYSKKTRRLALLGLFAVTLLMALSSGGWYHWHNLQKHQVVVLVADFKSLQSEDRGVEEEVIRQLEEALAEYDDVKVQALNEEITAQEGSKVARARGEKHHADIVLWGWYEETDSHAKVTVKFEVLEELLLLSAQIKPLIQPIAKLESFEIQAQLSQEMSYLTLFTIGLVRLDAEDYDGAIARFTKALEFVPDAEQGIAQDTDIGALYFYRGIAYSDKGELDLAIADFTQALKIHPEFADAYYNRGIAYSEKRELDLTIADYTQALKIYPEFTAAYNNRGSAYSDKGELDLAIADYTQALKIYPKFTVAYINRGSTYSDKGELDLAITDFNLALKFNPESADAYNNRGIAYYKKGELDLAIADFKLALKFNPEYYEAYISRGVAYSDKGELEKAIADYTQALKFNPESADAYYNRGIVYSEKGELDKAITDFTQALKFNLEYSEAYNNRGVAYGKKGELEKAITDYNQAIKFNIENAGSYNNRGIFYYQTGELDLAIADFTQALKFNPENAEAYNNRGIAYSDKGELDKAIANYTQALQIYPENAEAYKNRGNTYYDKGELDLAIADFTQALKFNPEDTEAYYNRGIFYYKTGKLEKAIADYNQALKFNSEFAAAYNNRGNAYSKKGELDKALADFTQALKFNPEFAEAYANRGTAYSDRGELDKAIADFTQALKFNPEFALTYNNRGIAYFDKRELDKAIADFTQALKFNPKYAEAYANRGIACSKLGDKQKAIQDFKKAAKLFAEQGNTANQQKALELLKQL